MKRIKRVSSALTLFSFFYFVTMAYAEMGGNCAEIVKNMKVPLNKAMAVHKGMRQTLNSDQPIDKYNRHVNILVSNLDREVSKMERLLGKAEQGGCNKLATKMRDRIISAKNIYHAMMTSMQLPAPKEFLIQQNDKLRSELDHLLEIH